MTQKAKKWLYRKSDTFTIKPMNGGIVGSLIGLGYIKRIGLLEYEITEKGKQWLNKEHINDFFPLFGRIFASFELRQALDQIYVPGYSITIYSGSNFYTTICCIVLLDYYTVPFVFFVRNSNDALT